MLCLCRVKQIRIPGIYPSTLTNVQFLDEDCFTGEKGHCKVIAFAAWVLDSGFFWFFWHFNVFKAIRRLTMALKKLCS